MPIREWSEDDRPREKLLKYGEHTAHLCFQLCLPRGISARGRKPLLLLTRGAYSTGELSSMSLLWPS